MTAPSGPPSGGGNAPTNDPPKEHPVHPPHPEKKEKDDEKE